MSPTQKRRGGETYLLTGRKKKLLSLNRWLDLENCLISAAAVCRAERKQRNLFKKNAPPSKKNCLIFINIRF